MAVADSFLCPNPPAVNLSHIIVNYHNSDVLRKCIESIYGTVKNLEYEIIVVDNSCGDNGIPGLKKSFPDVRFIENAENVGFAQANNQAARLARGEILLFLNPDIELTEGAVNNMAAGLGLDPSIAILGPKVLNADGSLQYSCRSFPTIWTGLFNRYSLMTRFFPENRHSARYLMTDFDHNSAKEVDWLSGCCMMTPRSMFFKIGLFDENYFLFNEDVDLCKSAKTNGCKVVYYPSAVVYHHITSSNRRLPPGIIIKRHLGMIYYCRKHHRASIFSGLFVNLLITLRCFFQLLINFFK